MAGAEDPQYIAELFGSFAPVDVRRMFGGAGLFVEGLMIGLVDDGVIYLKADDQTIPAFEREGLEPFSYQTKSGSRSLNSYWRMPERLYDDPDELAQWAAQALQAARRATVRKSGPRTKVARPKRNLRSKNKRV